MLSVVEQSRAGSQDDSAVALGVEDTRRPFPLGPVALAASAVVSAGVEEGSMAVAAVVASVAALVVAGEASEAVIGTLVVRLVATVAIEMDFLPETRPPALVALTDATATVAIVASTVATVVVIVVVTEVAASTTGAETGIAIIAIVTATAIMTAATDPLVTAVDSAIATVAAAPEATMNQLVVGAKVVGIVTGTETLTAPAMMTTESEDMKAEVTRIPGKSADTKLPQIPCKLPRSGATYTALVLVWYWRRRLDTCLLRSHGNTGR